MRVQYFLTTRALLVASVHRHLGPMQTAGLRLLVRTLPATPIQSAHDFCAITALPMSVKRALIKHNVSVAYEAHQLLQQRERSRYVTTNGAQTPGEANHGTENTGNY